MKATFNPKKIITVSRLPRSDESAEIRETIRRIALGNAIAHEGKAQINPVLGKLLGEKPQLRKKVNKIAFLVKTVVQQVNSLPLEEQMELVRKQWPEMLEQEKAKVKEKKGLPPLPNVEKYDRIVTRFAPNPDAVLHLGSARAVILSHEYARMYDGTFVLRFEDTDPRLKKSALEFYVLIKEDLRWLGCEWDVEYIQSDRVEIYYEIAEKLLRNGNAYVCTCKREAFRKKITNKEPCPCRSLKPEENMKRWEAMLNGEFDEGEAVVRIKTDLNHPNPAIRDWPAFRIIDPEKYPHPRVGKRYRVWPLFAFANGVDDHLNGVTHIIRGKEHLTNQRRQEFLYAYLGWKYPEAIHYGRLKISGATLSKSEIVRGIQDGTYSGWDDPRLATFRALARRGIQPQAIRQLILDVGPNPVDVTLSWRNLYSYNRKLVDPVADRFFFVAEPLKLVVEGVEKDFVAHVPFHPDNPERGHRILEVKPRQNKAHFFVSGRDSALFKEGSFIRLMELFNIQVKEVKDAEVIAVFHSESYEKAQRGGFPLIHWLPSDAETPCHVVMPDASVIKGFAEWTLRKASVGQIVQFERFGFVRIDELDDAITAFFAHR